MIGKLCCNIGVNAHVLSSLQGKGKIFLYSSINLLLVCTYYINLCLNRLCALLLPFHVSTMATFWVILVAFVS